MDLDWRMVHELVIEAAIRAVTEGMASTTARQLDEENPVIPLAIDVDGDVAVATLLSWSEQDSGWEPSLCNVSLIRHEGHWCRNGESSGLPPRDYPLTARRPADPPGLHVRLYEAGPQSSPRGGRGWIEAAFLISAEVEDLRVGDRRRIVPFHGYVPVVARNSAQALVTAISHDGSVLETIDLRRQPSDLFRELRRRDPDNWPFKVK